MNRGKSLLCMMLAMGCVLAFSTTASAHKIFKDKLSEKYPNVKISCNACHVKGEKKSVRNNYGKLFFKTFENKKLTAEMPDDRDEKKEYAELWQGLMGEDNYSVSKMLKKLVATEAYGAP